MPISGPHRLDNKQDIEPWASAGRTTAHASHQITRESRIRSLLRDRYLRHHRGRDDVLIINELGLAHARSRIDLAVFNGILHGYEIKSARDTLTRLPNQLDIYRNALQKLTLVVASCHINAAAAAIPEWCGLQEIIEGPKGGLKLALHRKARLNPEIDPFMLSHLLWRSEVQALLRQRGELDCSLNVSRARLYRRLADVMPLSELAPAIKLAMSSRINWRDH